MSFEDAEKFSKKFGFDYFETSAKDSGSGVKRVFSKVAETLLRTREQRQANGHIGDVDIAREETDGIAGAYADGSNGNCTC